MSRLEILGVREIPVAEIEIDEISQPRWARAHLKEIAKSIERVGILEPPLVRYCPNLKKNTKYRAITGHSRILAVRDILNWTRIPARVAICTDEEEIMLNLVENYFRYAVSDVAKGEAIVRAVETRKKLEPDKSEQQILWEIADDYGFERGRVVMWYIQFKKVRGKFRRKEKAILNVPDEQKVLPSKMLHVGQVALRTNLTLAEIQKLVSIYKLPSRGLAKLNKEIKKLFYQGFFHGKDKREILEWIDEKIKELRQHGVQCTFWGNKERIQQINEYCRKTNRDRDEFLDYLVGLGWRQYIRNNLREFHGDNTDN